MLLRWCLLFFPFYLFAMMPMDGSWHYIWGDSPRDSQGKFLYLEEAHDHAWKSIDFPSNPPERNQQSNIWFKYTLPEILPPDPAIYIFSIDLTAQLFLEREKLYQFGEMDDNGLGRFAGWPWHLIGLPEGAAGKTLYFRIYSNATDIGLWGEVNLVSKGEQYQQIVQNGFPRFLIGGVAMAFSLLYLILYLVNLKNREYLYLGLLMFTQGLDLATSSQLRQMFFDYPLLAQYILAFCYFFFPVGVALFMEQLIGSGKWKLIRRIWQGHLIYLTGALGASLAGIIDLANTYPTYDTLYYTVSAPILLVMAGIAAYRGNSDSRVLFVGYLVVVLFYLYSTVIAKGWVSWSEYPTHYAIFFFMMLLTWVAYCRMVSEHQEFGKIQAALFQQSKMAKLGEMLQVIIHQWKQPLTVVNLYASDIKDRINDGETDQSEIVKNCDNILKSTNFMKNTMEDFRNFFKPDKKRSEMSLRNSLDSVMGILQSKIRHTDIQVIYPESDIMFDSIPNELNQVLLNLIDNAKDALSSRDVKNPKIQIRAKKPDQRVIIEIEDNGGGFDKEYMKRLFEAYVTTKGEQGNGIGLYMCKMIVEESLKGEIAVENTQEGALVRITFPG